MKKTLQLLLLITCALSYSQKKTLKAVLINGGITIDGNLGESQWQSAPVAKDFFMFAPDNGKEVDKSKDTEVKILYDNEAIYIGAILYDAEPSKILKELTQRDDQGTSDNFGVFINGFNDGQQDFRFFCTASGTQLDCLATDSTGEDFTWDAIWSSKTKITDKGWVVEMKIPYAALRFSNNNVQTWGINFVRDLKRENSIYAWNKVDNKVDNVIQQAGNLEGIENIKTPTRLFFMPYSSFYLNANDAQKTKGTLKGGMDIKYGINDAFTLDAILIPDFGQTKYDDQILNLGPFEQQFNENRAFFTEGTDLFNKGGIFYSRRIGGSPSAYPTVDNNEEIIDNPATVNLINALKVSGRTKGGLGIGVLNAVTETTTAKIRNNNDQSVRSEVVEPLANYSIIVLDQRFRKNSSVSFINTNVTRDGSFRDGNVSGLIWDLNTKANTYNLSGDLKYSYVNEGGAKTGIASSLNIGETSGQYRYSLGADIVTKDYDINDLGINFQTNYYSLYGNANYRILNSTKYMNSFNLNLNSFLQFQKETGKVQGNNLNFNVDINNKKNHYFGFGINANPLENFDFYEPRTESRFVLIPSRISWRFYFSSNYNYKFAFDFNPWFAKLNESGRNSYGLMVGPRYRFSDKFLLNFNFNFSRQNNNKGFVDSIDDDANSITPDAIIFANRNVITYSNTLSGKYSVNSTMTFNLSVRHYWSYAENKNFLSLDNQGKLNDFANYTTNKNSNFTSWNVDLSYSWWFAPGSQLSVLYRNNAANFSRTINSDFGSNVTNLLNNEALNHTFSISMRYFIDYNQAKKLF